MKMEYIISYNEKKILVKVNSKSEILCVSRDKFKLLSVTLPSDDKIEISVLHQALNNYFTITDENDIPESGILQLTTKVQNR